MSSQIKTTTIKRLLLKVFSLFAGRHGLQEPYKVERLQMKIISSLRDHVTYNV